MFHNKVVAVTGGAHGIGKCIAEEFQKSGADVCIIDKRPNAYFTGDVAEEETLRRFSEKVIADYGRLDHLVNNALPLMKGIQDCSYDEFNYALRVGVTAPFYLAKLFLPYFAAGASIVNISSSRDRMSQPQTESYTAAKGGLDTAQYNLGVMYLRGEGVPRNEEEGIIWLERAAEQNNEKAKKKLAHLKIEIDHELPTEEDLLKPVKHKPQPSSKSPSIKVMTVSRKEPPLYAHLASYYTQETLEKGWEELKQTFPELSKFKTLETQVTLPEKGKYIRLYIKGKPEEIKQVCSLLNAKKQYCLISYP